jgi:hypothetical protein
MIVMDPQAKNRTGAPDQRKVYTNRQTAMADIEALAKSQGQRFYLLEAVASAVPVSAPIVWSGDVGSSSSTRRTSVKKVVHDSEEFY